MKKKVSILFAALVVTLGLSLTGDAFASCITCLKGANNGKCTSGQCSSSNQTGTICCGNTCPGCSLVH
jgi:hypothetical protein